MADRSTAYQKIKRGDDDSDQLFEQNRSHSQHSLYSDNSDESLPLDAPLVRQPRCSIDIDTIKSTRTNSIGKRENAYLDMDSKQLSDSIQEFS